jgi:hypothetical protein
VAQQDTWLARQLIRWLCIELPNAGDGGERHSDGASNPCVMDAHEPSARSWCLHVRARSPSAACTRCRRRRNGCTTSTRIPRPHQRGLREACRNRLCANHGLKHPELPAGVGTRST